MQQGQRGALLRVSLAVLLASSVWFTGTAVAPALTLAWHLSATQAAFLTGSVQLGFITGTFLYSITNLSDVFNARRVFAVSASAGALLNLGFGLLATDFGQAVALRFLTGVVLAGVYPVGMKIIATWFASGLGSRLGVMVGALTLGTASPYLISSLGAALAWRDVVTSASVAALLGALLISGLDDGPYAGKRARFDARMMLRVFAHRPFRLTALGYFGHMWELYAFWSLVTLWLARAQSTEGQPPTAPRALLGFFVIGIGAFGCVIGGWLSRRHGERQIARVSLIVSASCCLCSGFAFALPSPLLWLYVLVWGVFVVSDSPQFSALAARHAPVGYVGTALTVQNGVGFAVTLASIQLIPLLAESIGWRWAFSALGIGPVLGALALGRLARAEPVLSHSR